MSIPVACRCGQHFMAQPHLAGTIVRCPVCGQAITVPGPGGTQAAPAMARGQARPQEPQRSGAGPLLYVGIIGGLALFLLLAAVAAVLIGYDVARGMLGKSSPPAVNSASAENQKPSSSPSPPASQPVTP